MNKIKIKGKLNDLIRECKKDKVLFIILVAFLTYIVPFVILRYIKFDYNYNFGYLDHQLYWEVLHRLLDGQVLYKDFYWEYGPLYLLYSLPLFVVMNKTFSAYVFIRLIFLPITGLVLAYFLGKELLRSRYLVLFLFIGAMYSTINFTTIRHIVAELGLVITLLGLLSENRKKVIIGSLVLGVSFMAGIEYALLSGVVLTVFNIWSVFLKGKSVNIKNIVISYLGLLLGSSLFFGYLILNGALSNYVRFFSEFSASFFYLSPCRSGFPKLNADVFSSLQSLRRLNLYMVPFINLGLFVYLILREKGKKHLPLLISLLLFSGLAYVRTFINPCLNTVSYSITLLLLVIVYVLNKSKKRNIRVYLFVVLLFLAAMAVTKGPLDYLEVVSRKSNVETAYLSGADIKLDNEKVKIISEVVDYINEKTDEGDYIYVYPYGPYNQLTNTKSPVNVAISTHYELAPFLVPKVIENLELNKPEYVVINRINAWSYLAAMYIIPQAMAEHEETPVFVADLTNVEKYISMNYAIDKKFDKVWVLKRKDSPTKYISPYIKRDVGIIGIKMSNFESEAALLEDQKLFISGPNPEVAIVVDSLEDVDLVKFPNKVNLGLFKYTSQYTLQAFLFSASGQLLDTRADIMATEWQKLWMEIRNDERLKEGALIVLRLSKNRGIFSLGGAPRSIELKYPEFYQFNPEIFDIK